MKRKIDRSDTRARRARQPAARVEGSDSPHPKRPAFAPHGPLCAPRRDCVESQYQTEEHGAVRRDYGDAAGPLRGEIAFRL